MKLVSYKVLHLPILPTHNYEKWEGKTEKFLDKKLKRWWMGVGFIIDNGVAQTFKFLENLKIGLSAGL